MKVTYLFFLFVFACQPYVRRITPATKMQIVSFWVATEDELEYYVYAINFLNTDEIWVLWTGASEYPEFLDVFQIDYGDNWSHPFSGLTGTRDVSTEEYVADLFLKSYKRDKVKIIRISR